MNHFDLQASKTPSSGDSIKDPCQIIACLRGRSHSSSIASSSHGTVRISGIVHVLCQGHFFPLTSRRRSPIACTGFSSSGLA